MILWTVSEVQSVSKIVNCVTVPCDSFVCVGLFTKMSEARRVSEFYLLFRELDIKIMTFDE